MNDELKQNVSSLLVSIRAEYRRLHANEENDTDYGELVAKVVDVLEELEALGEGTKPYRIR